MILLMSFALAVIGLMSLWVTSSRDLDRNRPSAASRLSTAFLPQRAIVVAERRKALQARGGTNDPV
ncbi:MAG: hypothetical protein AAGA33_09625 [Pseudomonadota bacterium]